MPTRPRRSYMQPEEFRALRESTGLTPTALSYLLDCGVQSIRNMESGSRAIGKQMAMLMILVSHPTVRALYPEIFRHKDEVLKKISHTP